MRKTVILFVILFPVSFLSAQKNFIPETIIVTHQLGDDPVTIKLLQYGDKKDIVFINLHSDETTSLRAAEKQLQMTGGLLVKLENNNKRNISFRLGNSLYTFDPNRIFSQQGIELTLANFKSRSAEAIIEVQKFANHMLQLLPAESSCVIALHNNTNGNLSVNSFLTGNQYATDAKKVFANDKKDPDDFFLTTDSLLFQQLSAEKYNTVWQDNERVQQDGSLSVYFGERNTRYLNCETEHGKAAEYAEMLSIALKYINPRK